MRVAMATSLRLLILCLSILTWNQVTSFSIRHRSERSTNLADALAILQQQRRRMNIEYPGTSDDLGDNEPLTLQDLSYFLTGASNEEEKAARNEDLVSNWEPSGNDFNDFDPSEVGYDLTSDNYPTRPVEASPDEVEAIFESETKDKQPNRIKKQSLTPSKKTKEELVNVRGDSTKLHKASNMNSVVKATSHKRDSSKGDVLLNSLTKDELKVLMKAVGKLQGQVSDDDFNGAEDADDDELVAPTMAEEEMNEDGDTENPSPSREETIVSEPATEEELESVFEETEGPITKETKIILEKGPGEKDPTLVEEQVVSESFPDEDKEVDNELTEALTDELADELEEVEQEQEATDNEAVEQAAADVAARVMAAAALEENDPDDIENDEEQGRPLNMDASKYWLVKDGGFYRQPQKNLKRTTKRASGVLLESNNDNNNDIPSFESKTSEQGNNQALINLSWLSPQLQAFVLKIVSLQDEVDRLKLEARLENLETDALTDALNEATLGQMDGTVSDLEWSSLQNAIRFEAALQDVKHSKPASKVDNDEDDLPLEDVPNVKRGEPWRRKRQPKHAFDNEDLEPIPDRSMVVYKGDDDDLRKDAVENLLQESYFLKGKQDSMEDDSPDIASLFMSDPEQCPAVQRYSSNCALADMYSMPVDFEARALCNLHEMCYACGNSLGVEQSQCDVVYLTAATSLCRGKEECEVEAEVFLRAMKLKTRYIAHEQPSCRFRCTAEFLGMF